jgi:hypothetical protein
VNHIGSSREAVSVYQDHSPTGESYGEVSINARLLDGYSERDGRSLSEGREIEVARRRPEYY